MASCIFLTPQVIVSLADKPVSFFTPRLLLIENVSVKVWKNVLYFDKIKAHAFSLLSLALVST